jgi:23S rRNA (cytosine1962-C5)-methyltransferase
MTSLPTLSLLKNRERRLLAGHDWVFSNEIDPATLAGAKLNPGQLVQITDHRRKYLASAWYNPSTLIAARILSRRPVAAVDRGLLLDRLVAAREIRDRIHGVPWYRWVHGESDRLPGLVIDRFGELLAVQIHAAGMESVRPALVDALQELGPFRGIVIQQDSEFRKLEGLPTGPAEVLGEVPEDVVVREGSLEFTTSLTAGQKTGWFYDQRDNRMRLARYVAGQSVADLYCYAGAWGLHAAQRGASRVTSVDSSAAAISLARRNADRNGIDDIELVEADCLETLKAWGSAHRTFDVVVIDPPALIKRRKDAAAGIQAYYQLNRLAARVVRPGGILVSCSCSHHLPEDELVSIVNHAAWKDGGRPAAILEFGSQSADHPVHPAMPETRYLKAIFARIG